MNLLLTIAFNPSHVDLFVMYWYFVYYTIPIYLQV